MRSTFSERGAHASSDSPGPLKQAEYFLSSGEEEKARDLAVRWRMVPGQSPAAYRGWGEVCRELGMARQAEECFRMALRIDRDDTDSLFLLAELCADVGRFEEAMGILRRIVRRDPGHTRARELLAENYRALGFTGRAEALCPQPQPRTYEDFERYFPPSVGSEDVARFTSLFAGREQGYAVQAVDSRTGEVRLEYRPGFVSPEIVVPHILGEATLAVYPMRSDHTVRHAVVSLHIDAAVREQNIRNRSYLRALDDKMKSHVMKLARCARLYGIPAYPEDAGTFSYRLWFFFDGFVHFLKAGRFAKAFLEKAPPAEGSFVVEPLLATKPVGIGWMERAVVLPLGIERSTGRRCLFLDADGMPYPEQLKHLRRIREMDPSEALRVFSGADGHREIRSSSAVNLPGRADTLARYCPVVNELVRRAQAGRILRREEKVVLFYAVGLLDEGCRALHDILEPCPDYRFEKVQRQAARLKPAPISCLKIRELLPEITASVGCNCSFDLRGGRYPSPVLHAAPHLVPVSDAFAPPENAPVRDVARRYIDLRLHLEEMSTALGRLERELDARFQKKKIHGLKIDRITLTREEHEGRVAWRMERT